MIIDDIEYLKSAYDIISELRQDLIAHNIDYLHDIKDGPKNVQITCPYHADGHERKPSAGIKKSSGVFHCFSCGETHSLPEVISYCFGKDEYEYGKRWLNIHIKERIYTSGRPHYKESEDIQTSSNVVSEKELDSYRYTHLLGTERILS